MWGRLRRGVDGARAGEQASLADLQAARLSAQGELAINYFNLRQLDVQIALQAETIAGYDRTLQIVQNRYNAGVAARTDVLQAETQLRQRARRPAGPGAPARDAGTRDRRAGGQGARQLRSCRPARSGWGWCPMYRRPCRRPCCSAGPTSPRPSAGSPQANEQIGIEQSAYFPSLLLSGSVGQGAASIGDLFSVSALVWSFGASAGADHLQCRRHRRRASRALAPALDEASARYRQTVLARSRMSRTSSSRRACSAATGAAPAGAQAADLVEQQVLNRYQAGQVSYTEVIIAQVTAQNARRALVQRSRIARSPRSR